MLFLTLVLVAAAAAAPIGPRTGVVDGFLATLTKKKLTFDNSGHFKVVSFSDMHMGERWGDGSWASWGPANDASTQRVHGTILDQEKPQFVVFNGDLATGENVFASNATANLALVYGPTVDRGIPFSSTYGNHDNANNINHQQAIEFEQKNYKLSYTRGDVGPKPWGNANYWVPVYAKSTDLVPALIMWFFDSRSFVSGTGNGPGPVPADANYYWVDEKTVPAYIRGQSLTMKLMWGKVPPALVFVHIPFQHVQDMASLPTVGNHDDSPTPAAQGSLNNTYTGKDLPTFDALVELSGGKGNVLAITSGHDHGESWCARSKVSSGLSICFNGHSGYGGYTTTNGKVRNGRVFDVDLKEIRKEYPTVKTYSSYEDRTVKDTLILGPDYMKEYN